MTSPHGKTLPGKFLEAARQMAWHFWPALPSTDSLLVPAPPPKEFLEYLVGLGFTPPEFRTQPDRDRQFTPFGWSREAEDLNRGYRNPAMHPDRNSVAKVNSREFGVHLEAEEFPESRNGFDPVICRDVDSLRRWLEKAPAGRYVGKGNHGFGGLAQIRFNLSDLDADSREKLEKSLFRHGGMVIEGEDQIEAEFGVLFRLGRNGRHSTPRIHRLFSDGSGGFSGTMMIERDPELQPWRSALEQAVDKISARLFRAGYFGPVGFDAYVRKGTGGPRLRPFSDLNARCTMAYATHGLATVFPGRAVSVLQFSTKSMHIPEDYSGLRSRLGMNHMEPGSGRGIFLLTPLGVGMQRHSLVFAGNGESDLRELQFFATELLAHG